MTTPQERARQLWTELSMLIPFEDEFSGHNYDYQALAEKCEALIVKALIPPIDKTEAFAALIEAMATMRTNVAGGFDAEESVVMEALYVYREAILSWQRGILDEKARDAELAIRALRGYTR